MGLDCLHILLEILFHLQFSVLLVTQVAISECLLLIVVELGHFRTGPLLTVPQII